MLDEHEWRSVLEVAKEGTFSAAAKRLFISQPSLSQCIKKIEGELGMQLFDRSQNPLQLTEAGRIYLRQAREMQRIRQKIIQQTADLSGMRMGNLCIGSSRTRSACFLMAPLIEFHRRFPGIHLMVKERPVEQLKEAVKSGEVDFALLYEPLDAHDFQQVPLLEERILLAVPMDHPFAGQVSGLQPQPYPVISFARFQQEPFIKLQNTRCMAAVYDRLCRQTQTEPDVVLEANSILDAAEFCAAGMGATLVTNMLSQNWRGRESPFFFELAEPVEPRHLVAAYGRHQALSQAAEKCIELLQQH